MPPTLELDDRQRAMLREMGVQVWQPRSPAPAANPPVAVVVPALPAALSPPASGPSLAAATVHATAPAFAPAPAPLPTLLPARLAGAVASVAMAPTAPSVATAPTAVLRGEWQAVFSADGDDPQSPIWLVLADGPSADPREGDAGRLLSAMLRAAGLHKGARLWAGSVGRPDDEGVPLADALRQALAAHRPAMVLTLGRLASQAVLASTEPLGKLRGQVFSIGQVDPVPLVASYEPGWLLRSQDDKARAWEDLCRALSAVRLDPP